MPDDVLQGKLGGGAPSSNVVCGVTQSWLFLSSFSKKNLDQPGRVLIKIFLCWSQLGFIDHELVTDVDKSSQSSKGQTKTNRSLVLQKNFDLKITLQGSSSDCRVGIADSSASKRGSPLPSQWEAPASQEEQLAAQGQILLELSVWSIQSNHSHD